jgi:inosine triphosphate pyrophosphatase
MTTTTERPTLVTGNAHKIADFGRVLLPHLAYDLQDVNIDESQGPSREHIITAKARSAFEVVGGPVIVEDVAAGLDALGGMPGPFIKHFEDANGEDALLKMAAGHDDKRAFITSTIALYDGESIVIGKGEARGIVVPMRGENSYGFDKVFVPDGQIDGVTKTLAEMSFIEKDAVSERVIAVHDLLSQLALIP